MRDTGLVDHEPEAGYGLTPMGADDLLVVGVGVRSWHSIRVGAEGFVLVPVTGQDVQVGGGITVGIEFK